MVNGRILLEENWKEGGREVRWIICAKFKVVPESKNGTWLHHCEYYVLHSQTWVCGRRILCEHVAGKISDMQIFITMKSAFDFFILDRNQILAQDLFQQTAHVAS